MTEPNVHELRATPVEHDSVTATAVRKALDELGVRAHLGRIESVVIALGEDEDGDTPHVNVHTRNADTTSTTHRLDITGAIKRVPRGGPR